MPSASIKEFRFWILILAITVSVPVIASAAAIVVNDLGDTTGNCTLRKAINNANADADTTGGECAAGSGVDTITFSVSGTITLTLVSLPDITDLDALTIDGTGQSVSISGNNAVRVMGVVSSNTTLTLIALTIKNGNAGGGSLGGGLVNFGTLNVTNCTFSGNSAGNGGGGIWNHATATITNSTFSGNSGNFGGGIFNDGTATVTNSTFSGNSAGIDGGGIFNDDGSFFNAGTLNLRNTIIANSTSGGDCAGAIATNVNNLIADNTCSPDFTGDPKLNLLADNGGPTETMALQSGSPAIDAGNETTCANPPVNNLDQRGFVRPIDGDGDNIAICDIGAYEFGSHAPTIEAAIDIKFCSNPNAFNCKKKGVLPVTIFGTADLDVNQINLSTLQLCLANDTSSCVHLVDAQFPRDRGNPEIDSGTAACTNGVANPDGLDDIDVLFDAREVANLIDCGSLSKGDTSQTLIIKGELKDGTAFQSTAQDNVGIDELLIQQK